ncbi:MAG TPA: hypothetical protein VNK67_11945 [Burkholderiales bacterium]|nr:hypothetical protein [Burkholderiales bacterium]
MDLAEGIRRIGFRRWYERQLIESHLYLVSCFLSLVMVLACLEGFSLRAPAWEVLLRLAAMVGGAALGMGALARYKAMLDAAEYAAERSVCGRCAAYGILELTAAPAPAAPDDADPPIAPLGVRCRRCGHEWTIE